MKKNKNIIFIVLFFLLTACAAPPPASDVTVLDVTTTSMPTLTPSPSPSPSKTASPTATSVPTATPTPTPAYPLGALAPLPDSPVIEPDNISQVQPLLEVPERPVRFNLDFSDDGQWMMLATLNGATIYDTQTFAIKREFSNNFANFIEDYDYIIRPEHVYRFVPQKDWVIVNAEMIWDIVAEKTVFRDENMEEFDENKKYWGSWQIFEDRNDGIGWPLVRSFVSDVSEDGKIIVTGIDIWDMSRYRTTIDGVLGDRTDGVLSPDGTLYAMQLREQKQIGIFSPFRNPFDEPPPVSFRHPDPGGFFADPDDRMFFSADGKYLFVPWLKVTGFNAEVQWEVYYSKNGDWVGSLDKGARNNLIPGSHYYFLKADNPNPYSTSCSLHVYRLWPKQKINVLKVPAEPEICQIYRDWNSHYLPHQFFGNLLVAVTHNDAGVFRMNAWNIETGELLLDKTANEPVFVLSAQKDGLFYAFYKPDSGKIEVYDSRGALVFELAYNDFSARKIIHSPDGKLRALLKRDSVKLLDLVSGSVKQVFRPESDWWIEDAVFSKDSSSLLVSDSVHLWLYSVEDGSLLQMRECDHCSLHSYVMGENLLLLSNSRSVFLYDANSLKVVRSFSAPGNSPGTATITSSDGKFVAVSGMRNTTVFIYDTADGIVKAQLPVLKYAPNWMQFSSDGKTLYVADVFRSDPSARNMIQVWDVEDLRSPVMLREVHINRDWLADFIAPDELKGLDIWLESVSISPHQDDFIILEIRALNYTAQRWRDTHIRAFWRVNAEKPFAVAYISYSLDRITPPPLWVDASGSTEIPGELHCGNFSSDGRFLDCGSTWWGIRP